MGNYIDPRMPSKSNNTRKKKEKKKHFILRSWKLFHLSKEDDHLSWSPAQTNWVNCISRPYLPALSTTGLPTNKDISPVLANGMILVIMLLKSPIFHLSGIKENGKSGVTLHDRLQMWCISSDVNSAKTRATLGQPKNSNLDGPTTNQTRSSRE